MSRARHAFQPTHMPTATMPNTMPNTMMSMSMPMPGTGTLKMPGIFWDALPSCSIIKIF